MSRKNKKTLQNIYILSAVSCISIIQFFFQEITNPLFLSDKNSCDHVDHKSCDPCDHALSDHNTCRPFSAQLTLDSGNCCHTWGIKQAKYQKACCCQRCDGCKQGFRTSKRTESVETTLSFAINPVIKAVDIRQSPNPIGRKIGATTLAAMARILSFESVTTFRWISKVCKNQITRVAIKITVNALCKSLSPYPTANVLRFLLPAYGSSEAP